MSRISVLLAVVSGLVCVSSVQAASLQVSPISLDLTAPARTSSVTLRNNTDGTTNVQIRAYKWTQVAGVDQLMPANDVIVSPPAARCGQTQPIRSVSLILERLPKRLSKAIVSSLMNCLTSMFVAATPSSILPHNIPFRCFFRSIRECRFALENAAQRQGAGDRSDQLGHTSCQGC